MGRSTKARRSDPPARSATSPLPAAAASAEVASPDAVKQTPDTVTVIQQAVPTRADSISSGAVTLEAPKRIEVAAPVPIVATPELPTWDIDVHSYETTTR